MLTTRNYRLLVYSDLATLIEVFSSFQKLLKEDLLTTGLK